MWWMRDMIGLLVFAFFLTLISDSQQKKAKGKELRFFLEAKTVSREKVLIQSVLARYKRYGRVGRPVANTSDSIRVKFALSLIQIINLDEKGQLLTTSIWYNYEWTDIMLTWDPADFDNISSIRVPSKKVWIPDIVLYNFADTRLREQRDALVVVNFNGSTLWMPQAILKSTCQIDITYFPFDEQTCILKFGSWTYDGSKMDIDFRGTPEFQMSDYVISQEWDVLSFSALRNVEFYQCCPAPFIDLKYKLRIQRRVAFYSFILVLPCGLLSLLTLVIFWVPPESPAKLQLGMNIFVAFFVLLLLLAESTPRAASSIPLIGAYYCLNMVMITVSTVLSCVCANMFFRGVRKNRAPRWMRSFMIDGVAKVLLMREQFFEGEDGLRRWTDPVISDKEAFSRMTDAKIAKVRLIDTINETGDHNAVTHEVIDNAHTCSPTHQTYTPTHHTCSPTTNSSIRSAHKRRKSEKIDITEEEATALSKSPILEELRYIRHLIERVREQRLKREESERYLREWRVIAVISDRMFFVLYAFVNCVTILIIFFYGGST